MEALEFLKEKCREQNYDKNCYKCRFYEECSNVLSHNNDEAWKEFIEKLQQLLKEHPKKTYKDVFLEVFPNAKDEDNQFRSYSICVNHVFRKGNSICDGLSCEECWDQEYKENEE